MSIKFLAGLASGVCEKDFVTLPNRSTTQLIQPAARTAFFMHLRLGIFILAPPALMQLYNYRRCKNLQAIEYHELGLYPRLRARSGRPPAQGSRVARKQS